MDFMKYQDQLVKAGLLGFTLIVLYLGYTKTWVWGSELKDEQSRTATAIAERNKWMNLAIQGTRLAEQVATKTGDYHMAGANPDFPQDSKMTVEEIQNKLNNIRSSVFPGMESPK